MKPSRGRTARALALVLILVLMIYSPVSAAQVPSRNPDQPESTKTLKVLFVGNSFSVDTSRYLYQIADDAGYKLKIGDAWISRLHMSEMYTYLSCNQRRFSYLETQNGTWTDMKSGGSSLWRLTDVLKRHKWDVIIVNQFSADTGNMGSFYTNGSVRGENFLSLVTEYIHKRCPGAALGYNMTWAFPQNTTIPEFSSIYGGSQKLMYRMICDTTKVLMDGLQLGTDLPVYGSRKASVRAVTKGAELIDFVIPTGTAIQNARTSYMGDTMCRDIKHLDMNYGRYVAGLCAAASLGIPISGLSKARTEQTTSTLNMSLMKKCALDALKNPYSITVQQKKAPSLEDPELTLRETSRGYVKARWHMVRGATGYRVVYKKGGSNTVYTRTLVPGERSFSFKGKEGKNSVTVYALGDSYIKNSVRVTETIRIKD